MEEEHRGWGRLASVVDSPSCNLARKIGKTGGKVKIAVKYKRKLIMLRGILEELTWINVGHRWQTVGKFGRLHKILPQIL